MTEVGYQFIHVLTLQKTISNAKDYFKCIGSFHAWTPSCMDEDHQFISFSF